MLGVSQTTITRWERGAANIEHPLILEGALRDLATRLRIAPVEQDEHGGFFARLYALKSADIGRIRRGDALSIARVVGDVPDFDAYTLLVRLYALYPHQDEAEGNFGTTMRLLRERRPGSGFEQRFGGMIESIDLDDLEPRLVHAVKSAHAEHIPISWGSLLKGLRAWHDERTMKAWATSFWYQPTVTGSVTD